MFTTPLHNFHTHTFKASRERVTLSCSKDSTGCTGGTSVGSRESRRSACQKEAPPPSPRSELAHFTRARFSHSARGARVRNTPPSLQGRKRVQHFFFQPINISYTHLTQFKSLLMSKFLSNPKSQSFTDCLKVKVNPLPQWTQHNVHSSQSQNEVS